MKQLLLCVCIVCAAAACSAAETQELGFILGEPTGISYKRSLGANRAMDAAAAWAFSGPDRLHLHADHLWFKNDVFKEGARLPLYYGVGGRLKLEDKSKLGVRLPVGLQYFIPESRLTLFVEIAPILDLAPDTDVELNAAAGLRLKL